MYIIVLHVTNCLYAIKGSLRSLWAINRRITVLFKLLKLIENLMKMMTEDELLAIKLQVNDFFFSFGLYFLIKSFIFYFFIFYFFILFDSPPI